MARLAASRAEANTARARVDELYARMAEAQARAGDDVDVALRTGDRWEQDLAEAANAEASALTRVAALAREHARHVADYRRARATFRHPPAGGLGDETPRAADAIADREGQANADGRDELAAVLAELPADTRPAPSVAAYDALLSRLPHSDAD